MTDYNFLMESRLSPPQFQVVNHLSRLAASHNLNLYLVGGAVRDLTYGQQVIADLDFAVEGNPQRILRALLAGRAPSRSLELAAGPAVVPASLQVRSTRWDSRRASAELVFAQGVRAEIAMARTENYTRPGRRPEISPATIFEDLKRRDFSVNAMAISLHPNSRGLLLDPTNGAADIEKCELRILHSRSFQEDPARIYRLLRLGVRLRFKPEERTKGPLDSAIEKRLWQQLDPDQQGRELRAILQEGGPRRILKLLAARGLLAGLDRKLGAARIPYELFTKIRGVARTAPGADTFLPNFHCLVQKLGAGQKSRLARKIIGDKQSIQLALNFDRASRKLAQVLGSAKAALPSQTYGLLLGQPLPLLLFMLAHYRKANIQTRLKNYLLKFPQIRARLPRAELQTLGLKPGPQFEKILEQVFLSQLDGKIKTHQQLMKELRALAGIKEPPPKPARAAVPSRPRK